MLVNSAKVLQLLKKRLESIVIDDNLETNVNENEICDRILQSIEQLDGDDNIEFECFEELVDDELVIQNDEPVFDPEDDDEAPCELGYEYMQKVANYMSEHPFHTIKTIRHNFKLITHDRQPERILNYVLNGGTKRQKLKQIANYCYEQFISARETRSPVHDIDIRRWALFKAEQINLTNFVASHGWVNRFKRVFRISSRKICKFTSFRNYNRREEIENEGVELLLKFNDSYLEFPRHLIFNSDQSGFRYCHLGNRTLSHTGEKYTDVAVRSMNPLTHSYTIQPVINMQGQLLSPLFIVLKETAGEFGPRILPNLPEFPNLVVKCSKSGKLDGHLFKDWVNECLDLMFDDECVLYMDCWTGQSNEETYNLEGKKVNVEYFPAQSTSFMQPEDLSLFHPWKDFVKRFINHCLITRSEITVHLRNNVLKLQSLIHNQFSSNVFEPMFKYGWYKAGFPVEYIQYESLKEICFNFNQPNCSTVSCKRLSFMQCAYTNCSKVLCVDCFFTSYHFHH